MSLFVCSKCEDAGTIPCRTCQSSGTETWHPHKNFQDRPHSRTCVQCLGLKRIPCPECKGACLRKRYGYTTTGRVSTIYTHPASAVYGSYSGYSVFDGCSESPLVVNLVLAQDCYTHPRFTSLFESREHTILASLDVTKFVQVFMAKVAKFVLVQEAPEMDATLPKELQNWLATGEWTQEAVTEASKLCQQTHDRRVHGFVYAKNRYEHINNVKLSIYEDLAKMLSLSLTPAHRLWEFLEMAKENYARKGTQDFDKLFWDPFDKAMSDQLIALWKAK